MTDRAEAAISANDIAIVGMALRVPGARNIDEFWQNLRGGVESIRAVSEDELIAAGESRERLRHPNYVRATAELPGMEMFDPEFFGFSPKEAAIMDPQHRHFLECAWEAMEHAARTPESVGGSVGVFAGCGMGSYFYFNVCSHRELVDSVGMFLLRHTGNDKDFLSTRASHVFDLRGPSVNIQTACSTSLVAVHAACQSLLSGECDMALAGGVTIELPHRRGYVFQDGEILSPDGHCHAFDHRAAGTVFGSGVGVVVLRRLADALADGDPIHAVIKATAVNNDGANKAGYLAPSVDGQSGAIVEALGLADVPADSIQYVECHGTGTYLGDPIEVEALTQAYRQSTDRKGFCRIGSVKTNIGHLDTAAGVVSLIKTVLALSHREMPPSLGFEKPNPTIDFDNSPFRVNDKLTPWPAGTGPRRAAVNSLGVGGTNAHAIIEEGPRREHRHPAPVERPQLLLLTAKHRKALDQAGERLADYLSNHPEAALANVAYTLFEGRKHFDRRRVLAARDRAEAIALLRQPDPRRVFSHAPVEGAASVVFLFPGGGAQYPGMARGLYEDEAGFRKSVDEGLSYLPQNVAAEIRALWLDGAKPAAEATAGFLRPSLQLPAILIVEVALARLWMERGVKPAALIGHSMGENAAACIAGVLSFQDGVRLVHLRGELFDSVKGGGMLSVPLSAEELRKRLPDGLDLATVNAPELCVASGPKAAIEAFRDSLAAEGIEAQPVAIDIAAHSRMLEPILGRFEAFLRTVDLRGPRIPVVSNRSGSWLQESEAKDPMYWVRHLRETIQFAAGIATLAEDRSRVYIEVGPGKVLTSLVKAHGAVDANQVINSLRHPDEAVDDSLFFLTALGRAYATGVPAAIRALWDGEQRRRLPLPAYAFQHQRYFLDQVAAAPAEQADAAPIKLPEISGWGYRPAWKQMLADVSPDAEQVAAAWLIFLDDAGIGVRLVARLREAGHAVTTVAPADSYAKRSEREYVLSPEHGREGYDALVRDLTASGGVPGRIVHLWLITADESFRPGSSFFHRNQERGFYSLFFLAQALGDENAPRPIHITVAANGMQRVAGEALPYPEKATVLGPAKVIPKELQGITVRVIDLELPKSRTQLFGGRLRMALADPFAGRRALDSALAELTGLLWDDLFGQPASELAVYRSGRRWVQVYAPLALAPAGEGAAGLREQGVYLITGGLGDLALVIAEELARRARARLVLVGRAALPDRATWESHLRTHGQTDRAGRAIAAIQRLEALGAEVLHVAADVSNLEQMQQAVAQARARFGAIHGVIHAAGQVKDELIQLKALPDIEDVFTPKVHGTAVLNELFKEEALDLFVLFSSTSTDTAPAGQVDYVAANAYLNAYAESRAGLGSGRTLAIHWGVWNQVGLAARALRGESGAAAGRLRATTQPLFDRWVEDASGKPWLEATWSTATHWLLDEHRTTHGEALLPGTGYFELAAQAMRENGEAGGFEVEDLLFLRPLQVPDRESRMVRVRLEPALDGHLLVVKSGCELNGRPGFQRHAQATIRPLQAASAKPLDLAAIDARCGVKRTQARDEPLRSAQESHLRFGPRWGVLRSIALGSGEALAQLALRAEYRPDLERGYLVHPALLDLATGYAMELIDGYDAAAALWVPVSYKRVRVHRPLPATVWSWVRNAARNRMDADFAAFDVTVTDEAGNLVLEVDQFIIKRLGDDVSFALKPPAPHEVEFDSLTPRGKGGELSPAAAQLAAQVEQGILPAEGADAFMRALGTPKHCQIIVSSMDLELLRRRAAVQVTSAAPSSSRFERPDLDSEYVAPADEVERTLVGFWEELLGVDRVGVKDSFYDLGGHSLIAVRLFGMVRKAFAVDFPISVLFEAPTIQQCAALIRQTAGAAIGGGEAAKPVAHQARWTHLVPMHPGEGRRKTPFFLCAGMFGNVLNLRHLAHLIGTDRPFYGLQARGLYGDMTPHETFEDMARDYLVEVRKVQPHGPYLLGGFSGGGITAHAMARQLQAEGEEVALLVMLDTPLPTQPRLSAVDRASIKLQDFSKEGAGYVSKWVRRRVEWELRRLRSRFEEPEKVASEQFHNEAIEAAFRAALPRYRIGRYPGKVALFRPALRVLYRLRGGRLIGKGLQFLFPDNGWTPYVREISVHEVPGDHDSMVLEPNVRVLAEKLRACIDRAESEAGTEKFMVAAE